MLKIYQFQSFHKKQEEIQLKNGPVHRNVVQNVLMTLEVLTSTTL